ncbi:MAG: hypothetical protein F4X94_08905, partial [Dehalococcoidia bacterium]|nr:hypothetical protein [Dehalococcoidia bacterium]
MTGRPVAGIDDRDGVKFLLEDGYWTLIRCFAFTPKAQALRRRCEACAYWDMIVEEWAKIRSAVSWVITPSATACFSASASPLSPSTETVNIGGLCHADDGSAVPDG